MRVSAFFLLLIVVFGSSCRHSKKRGVEPIDQLYDTVYHPRKLIVENSSWGTNLKVSCPEILDTTGIYVYYVRGSYKNKPFGFDLGIPKSTGGESGFGSGIYFKSIGKESDYFLQALAEVYQLPVDTTLQFADSISVNYANLPEMVRHMMEEGKEVVPLHHQFKIFVEAGTDAEPGELFLNFDREYHLVELEEKDSSYRSTLVKGFAKKHK
jgi:hypothetical protein